MKSSESGHATENTSAGLGSERENRLAQQVDLSHPNWKTHHIAITMDGNGRWAKSKGFLDRVKGHEAGSQAVRAVVETAARLHLKALTLYAFSRENWNRPKAEVTALMHLFSRFLVAERAEMMENNIRFLTSGRIEDFPGYVRKEMDKTLELTSGNTGLVVNLAVSYSGREEIVAAAQALARKAKEGSLDPADITPELFAQYLYTPEIGDPDLFIRTSGEHRISNFLLWQMAYSEIYFTDVLWPDFRGEHLLQAMIDFQKRQRRFGGLA